MSWIYERAFIEIIFINMKLEKVEEYIWEIPKTGQMNVPGRIFANERIMKQLECENMESLKQVVNVSCLPGILKWSLAMPDIHWGYGFPIGGVAAFDIDEGIISPGGVGYDINCGVRLAKTNLVYEDIKNKLNELISNLYHNVPAGVGSKSVVGKLSKEELKKLISKGVYWAIERGFGSEEDIECIEDLGKIEDADFSYISDTAFERGREQIGTLGSGNHFLEIDIVDEIYDNSLADYFKLNKDLVCVLVHSGSRGFGHQICEDYIRIFSKHYGDRIALPDKQLICAPFKSSEGHQYYVSMNSAANFAYCNRQILLHLAKKTFLETFNLSDRELGLELIYDVCHNMAKVEEHIIDGKAKKVVVHRKGATRALPRNHTKIQGKYQHIGQPVIIPGDMGRYSFLCIGLEGSLEITFGSSCHGAGRVASRSKMIKQMKGRNLKKDMFERGVLVMAQSNNSIAEEMPEAYKDVSDVVDVMKRVGVSEKIARLKPIGVIKG